MKLIGVTGTLGAGKSTVGWLFERWGARRIDADELAREAVRPGSAALARIVQEWDPDILDHDGELDRAALRQAAFADPEARRRLEAIVHPEVVRLLEERVDEERRRGAQVVMAEIPLLFEAELADRFDTVVVVDAPRELRRSRLQAARGLSGSEFDAMDAAQWPAARKRAAADHVIDNDAAVDVLEERARAVWDRVAAVPSGQPTRAGLAVDHVAPDGPAGESALGQSAPGASESALGQSAPDGPGSDRRWSLDLHMHTRHSHDCLSDPADVVRTARERGLDRIAITDHNEIDGAFEARELDPELVIVGEEVRTAEGLDLIGLFLRRHIARGGTFREVAEEIRAQDGIVYLPHPFCPRRGSDDAFLSGVADCIDAVEGFNARLHHPEANARAVEWAHARGLPLGAGSDAHMLLEIGRARVSVPPFEGPAGFLSSLGESEIEGRASGRWVHLGSTWAKLWKQTAFA